MGLVLSSTSRDVSTPLSSTKKTKSAARPKRRKTKAASTAGDGISTSQIVGGAAVFGLGAVFIGLVWSSFR